MEAHSAGIEPSRLNTYAVAAMQEKGIDISGQHAKALDEELARRMDVVVTVCGNADEQCPVLPSEAKRLHWPLEDPAAATGSAAEILVAVPGSPRPDRKADERTHAGTHRFGLGFIGRTEQ